MILDTQNLEILSGLMIIHPLVYRKSYEWNNYSLTEILSLLKIASIGHLQGSDSVGNGRGWRNEGDIFQSHREPGKVVTPGKAPRAMVS